MGSLVIRTYFPVSALNQVFSYLKKDIKTTNCDVQNIVNPHGL